MSPPTLLRSDIPGVPCRRGKVRDVYDLGDRLVIVATDRLSAFDWVLPTPIPGKGRLLTQLTLFWLDFLGIPNHLLSTDLADMGEPFVTRFLPAEIAQLLHRHGFGELIDFGPEQARAAYFQGRTDIDIAGAQRLIAATVMPALPAGEAAHGAA